MIACATIEKENSLLYIEAAGTVMDSGILPLDFQKNPTVFPIKKIAYGISRRIYEISHSAGSNLRNTVFATELVIPREINWLSSR